MTHFAPEPTLTPILTLPVPPLVCRSVGLPYFASTGIPTAARYQPAVCTGTKQTRNRPLRAGPTDRPTEVLPHLNPVGRSAGLPHSINRYTHGGTVPACSVHRYQTNYVPTDRPTEVPVFKLPYLDDRSVGRSTSYGFSARVNPLRTSNNQNLPGGSD
jgi:hypothetical protein